MTVKELNRDQLTELKEKYLYDLYERNEVEDVLGYTQRCKSPSWSELEDVNDIISDEMIEEYYEGVVFSNDDFFCTYGILEEGR